MDHPSAGPPQQLLSRRQLQEWLGVSRPTIWRWIAAGTFPPPVHLGARCRRWRRADVQRWLDARQT